MNTHPHQTHMHYYENKTIIISIIIFLAIILLYYPLVTANFGYVDDYSFVQSSIKLDNASLMQSLSGDRILSGILTTILFNTFNSINEIKYIRLVSIIFISFSSVLIFYMLFMSGYSRKSSAAYAMLVACTPSFQIYGSWAVLVGAPLSVIFSVLAAFSHLKFKGIKLFVVRSALLLISLTLYQPTAMVFFSFLPFILYQKTSKTKSIETYKFSFSYIISGLSGMLLAYLALPITTYIFNIPPSLRSSLATDPISKIEWFFKGPLISSTNIFMMRPQIIPGLIILILFLSLVVFDKKSRRFEFILSLIIAIPLSYTPNLLVAGDWASNRTLIGLAVIWCGIIFLSINLILDFRRNIFIDFFISIFLFSIFLESQNNVMDEFVIPGSIEYAYSLHELRKLDPHNNSTVCVVESRWFDSLARYTSMDDFGRSAFSVPWSATSIFFDASHFLWPGKNVKFVLHKRAKNRCDYTINTMEIRTYRTYKNKLYTLGSNG